MGVNDGTAYPFLARELELVRSRLGEGRPLLGSRAAAAGQDFSRRWLAGVFTA